MAANDDVDPIALALMMLDNEERKSLGLSFSTMAIVLSDPIAREAFALRARIDRLPRGAMFDEIERAGFEAELDDCQTQIVLSKEALAISSPRAALGLEDVAALSNAAHPDVSLLPKVIEQLELDAQAYEADRDRLAERIGYEMVLLEALSRTALPDRPVFEAA